MHFPLYSTEHKNYIEFIKSSSVFPLKNKWRLWWFTDKSIVTASGLHHFTAGLSFLRKRGERSKSRGINTKNKACIAKNLADAFLSGLLSSFLSLCGTKGSNNESGLPYDQLLHLSNSQHHQLLSSDLSHWNISAHPNFCFASSVPCKMLLYAFWTPNAHFF